MQNLKRKGIVLVALIGLLATSGLAYAAPTEGDPPEDTSFSYAYDADRHILLWSISSIDGDGSSLEGAGVCNLDDEALSVTYAAVDGLITVEDGLITVENDGECALSGAEVAGPSGQINHGMFMKVFNSLFDEGYGRGCLNRSFAQSVLGKDTQMISVSDVSSEFVSVVEEDIAVVEFTTSLADCEHGSQANGAEAASEHGGRPESPGKSDSAPPGRSE